jgi:hypothetical protein
MTPEIARFLADLRNDPNQVKVVSDVEKFFSMLDAMAATDGPVAEFQKSVSAIVGREDRTSAEKVALCARLCSTPEEIGHA